MFVWLVTVLAIVHVDDKRAFRMECHHSMNSFGYEPTIQQREWMHYYFWQVCDDLDNSVMDS